MDNQPPIGEGNAMVGGGRAAQVQRLGCRQLSETARQLVTRFLILR